MEDEPQANWAGRGALARPLARVYTFVIAITVAIVCGGSALISVPLGIATGALDGAGSARSSIASASDVLGYAVRVVAAPDQTVSAQATAAMSAAEQTWQSADRSQDAAASRLRVGADDARRLDDLHSARAAAAVDMTLAVDALLTQARQMEGRDALIADVNTLAMKESAYADAAAAEGAFFNGLSDAARRTAEIETRIFVVLVLGVFAFGLAGIIAPAHKRSAHSMAQAIRREEQKARIGSEVARHAAERDRREAEAQFQALFRHSTMGVALTDHGGWILESNEALQCMLGFHEHELRGAKFGEWAIDLPSSGAETGRCERLYRRKDGTSVWVEETSTAAPGSGNAAPATIWMVQDIEQRKNAERQLQFDATHDALTGLRNRGHLDDVVAEAADAARERSNRGFTVLLIDLDRFKHINDTRGHAAGDAVLAEVGRRLRSWAAHNVVAARYGGDEFAVFIPDIADADVAFETATRLQEVLDRPMIVHSMPTRLTSSIGVCVWSDEFADGDAVVRAADSASYRAKSIGRARVVTYDAAMARQDDLRRRIGGELRGAIERGEMRLMYQPIVSLPARACSGFETLVRWVHPELGSLSPSVFIPVAEELGLMAEIGTWILGRACREFAGWQRYDGAPGLRLNVNVSPQQMGDPSFPGIVERCLQQGAMRAEDLVLEVTETAMLDWQSQGNNTLTRLRQMGISIVLDDFGTGYSSLSYLQLLPMDALKIDQSFVRGSYDALAAPAIVHALITLSKTLGISAVAEGVETEKQAAQLANMGCRAAQGFLFSPPLEAEKAIEFYRQSATRRVAG